MTTARYATSLTGGGAGALDAKAVGTLSDGDFCFVATGSILYVYKFVAAATDAESSPSKIRPDDYSSSGVWYLQNVSADYAKMARGDIDGGDITTSGQTITITATGCWDSTRLVWLETTVSKTVTASSTNNQEQYVFLVKLASDGSCEFRRYTTYAGAAADAQVSAWRFVSWGKNNSSGVLMQYVQVANRIQWIGAAANTPLVTSSLTTSFASYSLTSVMPVTYIKKWRLIGNQGAGVIIHYSMDGTNTIGRHTDDLATAPELPVSSSIYLKYSGSSTNIYVSSVTIRR